jgi:hypothetical protein
MATLIQKKIPVAIYGPGWGAELRRQLFACGPAGSAEADWIQAGRLYKFSLYKGASQDTILASVSLTREDAASAPNHSDETPGQN